MLNEPDSYSLEQSEAFSIDAIKNQTITILKEKLNKQNIEKSISSVLDSKIFKEIKIVNTEDLMKYLSLIKLSGMIELNEYLKENSLIKEFAEKQNINIDEINLNNHLNISNHIDTETNHNNIETDKSTDSEKHKFVVQYEKLLHNSIKALNDTNNEYISCKDKLERLMSQKEALEQSLNNNNKLLNYFSFDNQKHYVEISEKCLKCTCNKCDDVKKVMIEMLLKVQGKMNGYEFLIDKRLIVNLLLKYFESNSTKIKKQIKESLSYMLGMNNEERVIIGLKRKVVDNSTNNYLIDHNELEAVIEIINELINFIHSFM